MLLLDLDLGGRRATFLPHTYRSFVTEPAREGRQASRQRERGIVCNVMQSTVRIAFLCWVAGSSGTRDVGRRKGRREEGEGMVVRCRQGLGGTLCMVPTLRTFTHWGPNLSL